MQQLQIPPLNEGETYIGAIGNAKGEIYHLVLLPGDKEPAPHEKQMAWAQSIGGDLPNRVEQAILFAEHKNLFEERAYWSNQLDEDGWAWCQFFSYGVQDFYHTNDALRARAVRRLPI
ncbi:DUF1566 domain-containing protein [Herbaspirillum robiniae]|uniref:DUF1566 domain-containing protein n=1 Tax=Herbaspirillum robiniae TaxID=2014887 RepID=UPI0009A1FAD7|nr:DUF1566 domain-containing protein [Herbaspirillum robiniae]